MLVWLVLCWYGQCYVGLWRGFDRYGRFCVACGLVWLVFIWFCAYMVHFVLVWWVLCCFMLVWLVFIWFCGGIVNFEQVLCCCHWFFLAWILLVLWWKV